MHDLLISPINLEARALSRSGPQFLPAFASRNAVPSTRAKKLSLASFSHTFYTALHMWLVQHTLIGIQLYILYGKI